MAKPPYTSTPPGSAVASNPPPTYFDAVKTSVDSLAAQTDYLDVAKAEASDVSALSATVATKAPLASPSFTGNPTAPDQTVGAKNTRLTNMNTVTASVAAEAAIRRSERDVYIGWFADEAAARSAADTAEAATRRAETSRVEFWRPGDVAHRFTLTSLDGAPSALADLPSSYIANSGSRGYVARVTGDLTFAVRDAYRLEPGRKYLLRVAVARVVNTTDPDNDGVRVALRWLSSTFAGVSATIVEDLAGVDSLTTSSGRVEVSAVVSTAAGAGIDIVAPGGAIYVRPYVQVWGNQPVTDVEVIDWQDITNAAAYSPDLTAVEGRLTAIESEGLPTRMEAVEAAVAGTAVAEYQTVADAAAATIGLDVSIVRTLRYDLDSGVAPDDYQRVLAGPATLRRFQSADGAWWESTTEIPNSRQVGGDGVDDTAAIEALAASDVAVVNQDLVSPASAVDQAVVADVLLVGTGHVEGAYRKQVISPRAQSASPPQAADIVPGYHMVALNAARAPVAVIVGDSISTYDANGTGRQNTLAHMLESKIRREFPSRAVTFYNRSIGSTGYLNLDGFAFAEGVLDDVTWYTDPEQDWLDYIEALAPDAVFIAFGMNISVSLFANRIKSIIDKINAWAKRPDIVFCTNLAPSLNTGSPSTSVKSEQVNRDKMAGLTRSMAQYYGYGVLDFHRQFCMARDGFDPLSSSIINEQHVVGGTTSPWTCPVETIDFYCSCVIDCDEFTAGDDTKSITIGIGPGGADWVRLVNSPGGNIQVARYVGNASDLSDAVTILPRIESSVPFPTGNRRFRFEVVGNNFSMFDGEDAVNGRYAPPIISCNIMRVGGAFQPYIGQGASNPAGIVTSEDIWFYVAKQRECVPSVRDGQLYGREDGNGSFFNHPGNYIAPHVYAPVLNGLPFAGASPPYAAIAADADPYTNTTTSYAVMSDEYAMTPGAPNSRCEFAVKVAGIATGTVGGGPGAGALKIQARVAGTWTDVGGTEESVGFANVEANNTGASPAVYYSTTIQAVLGVGSRDVDGLYKIRVLGAMVTGSVSLVVSRSVAIMREVG